MNKIRWQCLSCGYVFDGLPPAQRKRRIVCPRCHSNRVYPGSEDKTWAQIAKEIYKRDNYQCQRCGESDRGTLVVHHIRPVGRRGVSEPSNLITLCIDCHNKAHWGLGYYLVYPLIWIEKKLGRYGHKERFRPLSKEQIVRKRKRRRSR
jgi:DNA-directed RNA polymerase subunit RPC12/RpoP